MEKNNVPYSLLILMFLLCSCGFQPVYERNEIYHLQPYHVEVTGGQFDGFYVHLFKKELESHLSALPALQSQKAKLSVKLEIEQGDIGYGSSAILRSQERIVAEMTVYKNVQNMVQTKKVRLDSVSSITMDQYEEFSNMTAHAAAKERIVKILANDVAQEFYLILKDD